MRSKSEQIFRPEMWLAKHLYIKISRFFRIVSDGYPFFIKIYERVGQIKKTHDKFFENVRDHKKSSKFERRPRSN